MKKIILLFVISLFISCNTNEESEIPEPNDGSCNFQGRVYDVTSYLYEIPVDFNNDNVYSNNIIDETFCYVSSMDFDANDGAYNMLSQFASARVITDSNGNLIQNSGCVNSDGARLTCFKNGEEIILTFNNNAVYTGSISDNGNTLTFVIPDETLRQYHLGLQEILNEDGTITSYEGAVTIRFELQ